MIDIPVFSHLYNSRKIPAYNVDKIQHLIIICYAREPISKCSILFKVKEGENFNHRNTYSISRIKI